MNSKYAAVFIIAAMMIAAFPIMASADDSDATLGTAAGEYTVFYYDSTVEDEEVIGWTYEVVESYDAAQAVQGSGFWADGDSMVGEVTDGTYPSPNYNYGDISTFAGIAESGDNVWNVLVYQDGSWVAGSAYLGWYTCYSDRESSWQTANVALYYGASSSASAMAQDLSNYVANNEVQLSEIKNVIGDSDFLFTFYLKVSYDGATPSVVSSGNASITAEELAQGKTVTAYGSNAYLALKWAFGSNMDAVDAIPGIHNTGDGYDYWTFYSWMNSFFGLSTVQTEGQSTPTDWTDDKYAYWCIYTENTQLGDESNVLADFVIGLYAPLSCATIADNTIALVYEEI